jgi:glycosyltransferase involved in cell wall biosynthesis
MDNGAVHVEIVLIIPFHNEHLHLPRLIRSLREQSVQNVPIVFIDNNSTDQSVAVVRGCEEARTGKWLIVEEQRVGKIHAMKTALAFCRERFGSIPTAFLDADAHLNDNAWILNSLVILESSDTRFGYSYSPTRYVGFDEFPVFHSAYLAYEKVLDFLIKYVGWFGNGQGFVCSHEIMWEYLQKAEITTEIDFRCCLFALFNGKQSYLNPSVVVSSGRRMVANASNFSAWCFYEREFYSKKDINSKQKLNLEISTGVVDLQLSQVKRFFECRAMKMSARNLIPLALFARGSSFVDKIKSVLGVDVSQPIETGLAHFGKSSDWFLTDRFETMIQVIEREPAAIALAQRIAQLMGEQYDPTSVPRRSHALFPLGSAR